MAGQAYVFSAATLPPEPCDAVSNLNLTTSGSSVTLTWTAAPGSPTGYKIDYDGGDLTTITTTSYTHNSVPDGLHTYTVTALYPGSCIPFGVTKTIIVGDMCMFKIVMQGDENDSWNDGLGGSCSIDVISGSTTYGTATMPYDSYDATSFIVVPSGELKFSWIFTGGYPNECQFQIYNSAGTVIHSSSPSSGNGGNGMTGVSGVFFTYENDCEGGTEPGDNLYNIYRGTTLIQSNYASTTYTDADVNSSVANTWSVKVACEEGGESAAVSKTLDPCEIPGDCNPPTAFTAVYANGCTEVNLSWNPPAAKSNTTPSNNTQSLETMRNGSSTPDQSAFEMIDASVASNNATRGTELLNESFSTGELPAGWLNIDADGDGYKWQFELRSNDEANNCPPIPSQGRTDAYCINSASYYNCVYQLAPNNWLITPQLELTGSTELTWWVKVFDSDYRDKYGVFISTTGTNLSDFTEIFTETPPSSQGTNWAKRTVNITQAGPCYIAFRHYNCYDLYIIAIDDIIVSSVTPVYYNIYKDDVMVEENYSGTTYSYAETDPTVAHTWKVKVVCTEGGESAAVSKTLEPCEPPTDCDPATLNDIEPAAGCNRLTWTMPAAKRGEVTITQSFAPGTGVIGSSGSLSFGVYNRFRPEDLVAVNGGELTKFVFLPGMGDTQGGVPRHNYTIRIYQGGSWSTTPGERTPGTLIFSQPLDNDNLDFDSGNDNIIMLTEPITIDASQELWIGYWCQATSPGGYPALTDVGPRKSGLGDVMNYQGWTTLYDVLSNQPYNWYMQGRVQITPLSVNIFRNGELIAAAIEETYYLDCDDVALPVCYKVAVHCPNGAVSELSNEKCVTGIKNNAKTTFSIVPNPATNNVTVTSGNNFHTIEVVSFLGQTVLSQPNIGNTTLLDVSTLTNGIYFIRITSDNGTNVQKFVKQ